MGGALTGGRATIAKAMGSSIATSPHYAARTDTPSVRADFGACIRWTRGWIPTTQLAQMIQFVQGASLHALNRGQKRLRKAKGPVERGFGGVPEEGLEPPTRGL